MIFLTAELSIIICCRNVRCMKNGGCCSFQRESHHRPGFQKPYFNEKPDLMQPLLSSLPFLGLLLLGISSFAQELSRPFSAQDATDTIAIQQVINLYSIVADQKRFELLSQIFTSDVTVNFNTPGVPILHGLASVSQFMSAALRDVVSYHAESTHNVDLLSAARSHATTYNSAKFFGTGQQQGQIVSRWGRSVMYLQRRTAIDY